MSNIIVSPTSGVIEFNTGDASGASFYTSTAPIRLDATGGNSWLTGTNVGIGTASPQRELEVKGAGNVYIRVSAPSASDSAALELNNTNELWTLKADDTASDSFKITNDGGTALTIDTSKNVGIGTNNPLYKLDVSGTIAGTSGNFVSGITIGGNPVMTGTSDTDVDTLQTVTDRGNVTTTSISSLGQYISGGSGVFTRADIGSVDIFGDAIYVGEVRVNSLSDKVSNGNAQINFGGASKTIEFETAATARMLIASGGNVGIGTNNPTNTLDVWGPYIRLRSSNVDSELVLSASDSLVNNSILKFGDNNSSSIGQIKYAHDGDSMSFVTSGEARMFISGDGRVGVGTIRPTNNFHVRSESDGDWVARISNSEATAGRSYGLKVDGGSNSADIGFEVANYNGDVGLRVRGDANVGIGTYDIDQALSLSGAIDFQAKAYTQNAATMGLYTNNVLYVKGGTAGLMLQNGDGSDQIAMIGSYMAFVNNSSETMRLTHGGDVGIGTNNPTAKLTVDGESSSRGIELRRSSIFDTGNVAMRMVGLSGSPAFGFHVSDVERMRITNAGNVGIGTDTPQEKLHVYNAGTARVEIEGTTGPAAFKATNNQGSYGWYVNGNNDSFRLYDFGASTDYITVSGNGNVAIGTDLAPQKFNVKGTIVSLNSSNIQVAGMTNSSDAGRLYANNAGGVTKVLLDSNGDSYLNGGNVGIGTNNPATLLQVSGGDISIQGADGESRWFGFTSSASANTYVAKIESDHDANWGGNLKFFTGPAGGGNAERMTIEGNGKVGISGNVGMGQLASDTYRLLVAGTSYFTDTSYWGGQGLISWSNHGGASFWGSRASASKDLMLASNNDWTNGIIVKTDGNVGIATVSPLATLDVRGDISGSGSFLGTGAGNRITNNNVPYLLSGDAAAALTLQDVTDNGATTTNAIIANNAGGTGITTRGLAISNGMYAVAKLLTDGSISGASAVIDGNLAVDTDTLYVNASTDRVGINEDTVDATLHLTNVAGGVVNQKFERAGVSAWRLGIPNGETYFAFDDSNDDLSTPEVVITTDGFVGIGSASPSTQLDVVGTGAFDRIDILDSNYLANPRLTVGRNANEQIQFYVDDMNNKITALQDTDGDGDHRFILDREFDGTGVSSFHIANSGNYQLTIDKDNKIGMGVNNPSDFNSEANRLVIGDGAGSEGMTVYAGTSNSASVFFADGTAGNTAYAGYVQYRHANDRLDFGAGGGTRMSVNGNGAGIGTYSPDAKLDVSGAYSDSIAIFRNGPDNVKVEINDDADIQASGWISSHNTGTSRIFTSEIVGDAASNALVMETDGAGNRTRLYNYGTSTDFLIESKGSSSDIRINAREAIRFYTSGSASAYSYGGQRMTIAEAGNVGIGSATPAHKLDVAGDIQAKDSAVIAGIQQPAGYIFHDFGTGWGYKASTSASRLGIFTDTAERLTIASNGNIGIGITAPIKELQVNGTILGKNNGGYTQYDAQGNVATVLNLTTANELNIGQAIHVDSMSFNVGGTDDAMFIDSSANVGIGVTNPEVNLHVSGTGLFESLAWAELHLDGANGGEIKFQKAGTTYLDIYASNAGSTSSVIKSQSDLRLSSNNSVDADRSLWLDSDGKFGIGTDDPQVKLDLRGDFKQNRVFFRKTQNVNFTNGVANQKVDFYWTGTQQFWGQIVVTLTAGYSNQNSVGIVKKQFLLGLNASNSVYTNDSRIVEADGDMPDNFTISDLRWDSTNSRYYITIVHRVSTGNELGIKIEAYTNREEDIDNFDDVTFGSVYTTDTTAYDKPYVYYNDRVGIGVTAPSHKLNVAVSDSDDGIILQKAGSSNDIFRVTMDGTSDQGEIFLYDGGEIEFAIRANTNASYINTPANFGIGTNAPAYKLDIQDAAAEIAQIKRTNGGNCEFLINPVGGDAKVVFQNSGTDIWAIGKDNSDSSFRISEGGALETNPRFTVDNGGNVGIGTTNPEDLLTVSAGAGGSTTDLINVGGTGNGRMLVRHIEGKDWGSANIGQLFLNYVGSDDVLLAYGGGDVGIGSTTTPQNLLHVHKTNTVGPTIELSNSEYRAYINSWGSTATAGRRDRFEINASAADFAVAGDSIRFQIGSAGDSYEKVRIDNNGYVGIGTGDPRGKLDIVGNTDDDTDFLTIHDIDPSAGSHRPSIRFRSDSAQIGQIVSLDNGMRFSVGTSETSHLEIRESTKNVGVGTGDPSYRLTVNAGNTNEIARFHSEDNDALISISDNTSTGYIGIDAANDVMSLGFDSSMGTSNNLSIDTAGLVGIGTTSINAGIGLQVQNGGIYAYNGDGYFDTINAAYFSSTRDLTLKCGAAGNVILQNSSYLTLSAHSGKVGIGVEDPIVPLEIAVTASNLINLGSSGPNAHLQFGSSSSTLFGGIGARQTNTSQSTLGFMAAAADACTATYGDMFFSTRENDDSDFSTTAGKKAFTFNRYTTNLMTIMRDGKAGIGTNAPSGTLHVYSADAGGTIPTNSSHDDLIIENNGNCGIQFSSPASSYQYVAFGDTASANQGYVRYYHDDNIMDLRAGGSDILTLSGAKVGVGVRNPAYKLHVSGTTTDPSLYVDGTIRGSFYGTDGKLCIDDGCKLIFGDSSSHIFRTAAGRMEFYMNGDMQFVGPGSTDVNIHIESTNRRVGIGTAAPRQKLDVSGVIAQSTTTVSALPSVTNNEGARSMVTDSQMQASSNFGATIAGYGGGSYTVPVWCDGAYWYIG